MGGGYDGDLRLSLSPERVLGVEPMAEVGSGGGPSGGVSSCWELGRGVVVGLLLILFLCDWRWGGGGDERDGGMAKGESDAGVGCEAMEGGASSKTLSLGVDELEPAGAAEDVPTKSWVMFPGSTWES